MINESNKVCLKFYQNQLMFINLVLYLKHFIYLFITANITFLSYIPFELLDIEHSSPISHKISHVIINDNAVTLVSLLHRGDFVYYNFQILHYISHKMKYVSSLRVAALACNIMLRTLPAK